MRTTSFTLAVVGLVATVAVIALNQAPASTNLYQMELNQDTLDFANFLAKYGKSYGTREEFEFRLN